jgi:hypothetical protein
MPNRIVDVVDALNAGVASGEDFFVTVMDDGGGTGTFARDNWERYRSRARTRKHGESVQCRRIGVAGIGARQQTTDGHVTY